MSSIWAKYFTNRKRKTYRRTRKNKETGEVTITAEMQSMGRLGQNMRAEQTHHVAAGNYGAESKYYKRMHNVAVEEARERERKRARQVGGEEEVPAGERGPRQAAPTILADAWV